MVGVSKNDLCARRGGRIHFVVVPIRTRRNPVGRTVEQTVGVVVASVAIGGHAGGMLFRFGFLILVNETNQVILPVGREKSILIGNLVEDVVEVVHGVDHLADVCL